MLFLPNNDVFNCFRNTAIGKRRDANSIGKRPRGGRKSFFGRVEFTFWSRATRQNKMLELIILVFIFRLLAPGKAAGQVNEASIRGKSVGAPRIHSYLLPRFSANELILSNLARYSAHFPLKLTSYQLFLFYIFLHFLK